MRCPRCNQENPENGQFCTGCGLPLTPEAYDHVQRDRKPSRDGAFVKGVLKAVCYVALFLGVQSAVIGLYSGYLAASYSIGLGYGQDSYDIYDKVMTELCNNLTLLMLISGVLTILVLALFFAMWHKIS